jgi:hypothetical protein
VTLSIPTPDIVSQAIARFDSDDRYGPADRVLSSVFSHHPFNDALEDVLIKVVLLNGLYNTNVFAVTDMARHIRDLGIDVDLATSSPGLVDRIAKLRIRDKTRRHYSFATKYCSWHRPEDYPIYDGLVEKLLWLYRRQYSFAEFAKPDLRDYPRYKAVLTAFRVHFRLEDLSFKQIDKFLWWTSKDLGL